jgi:hypothetical protein
MKTVDPQTLIPGDFDEAIAEAIRSLKQSTYIQDVIQQLKVTDSELTEHLATFVKLDADQQSVHQCQLAKRCLKSSGHYVLRLSRDVMGHLTRSLQPCPMLEDQLKVGRYLIYDDFNPAWKVSQLFNELNLREGRKPLYQYLMKVLLQQQTKGLYLTGPSQSGKTFALGVFSFRYALNELGTIGLLDTPKQLARLLALKRSDFQGFAREIDRLQHLKVLILDDVDRQPITEAMLTDILLPVFQARQQEAVLTMVTATLPQEKLMQVFKGYKDKRALMQEWIDLMESMTVPISLPAMMPL